RGVEPTLVGPGAPAVRQLLRPPSAGGTRAAAVGPPAARPGTAAQRGTLPDSAAGIARSGDRRAGHRLAGGTAARPPAAARGGRLLQTAGAPVGGCARP